MNHRILTTQAVLARIGGDKPICREKLRQLRMAYPELLRPIMRGRYSAEKVEKLIDILTGMDALSGKERHYDSIIEERIRKRKNGEHQSAIPH